MLLPIVELQQKKGPTDVKSVDLSELLDRRKNLRLLPASLKPAYLGGDHGYKPNMNCPLKDELLSTAARMHSQLRPRMEDMLKKQSLPSNKALEYEIRYLLRHHENILDCLVKESNMRPKYILDKIVAGKPGWLALQAELRQTTRDVTLRPLNFADFYIIRSPHLPV